MAFDADVRVPHDSRFGRDKYSGGPLERCTNFDTALGLLPIRRQAVVQVWSNLPQDIQQHLFEAAVLSQGESTRQQLAVFLHEKHLRTTDAVKARAMPEPDSKGG